MTPSGTPLLSWGWLSHSGDESEHVLLLSARPALDCLRDMRRLDAFTPRQIGERPRQLQHPVIRSPCSGSSPGLTCRDIPSRRNNRKGMGFGPRPDQHEVGGEGEAALGAADRDDFVFQGLPENFQAMLPKFRHFIQEEDAPVRQADFAGPRPLSAADEAGVRDGVMRRAEGPVADQRHVAGQHAGDRVDARHIQRLGGGHAREEGSRGGSAKQRLAGSRRT